jgi:hypothetical protein
MKAVIKRNFICKPLAARKGTREIRFLLLEQDAKREGRWCKWEVWAHMRYRLNLRFGIAR